MFAYEQERQACMSDMFSKSAVLTNIDATLAAMGLGAAEVEKARGNAEMRFEQLLRDREDKVVDEGVMQATLERAMAQINSTDAKEKQVG